MTHPHRQEVHRTQVAKCKAMATPLKNEVAPDAPDWGEYGTHSSMTKGGKFGPLGADAPAHDAGSLSRMLNQNPKAFR